MRAWSRSRPWSSSHELAPSATRARPRLCPMPPLCPVVSARTVPQTSHASFVITLSRGTGREEAHESRSGREDAELNGC